MGCSISHTTNKNTSWRRMQLFETWFIIMIKTWVADTQTSIKIIQVLLYTVYLGEGTWAQYNFIYFHKKSADKSSTWYLMLVHPIHYASSFNNFELQRHLAFIYNNRIFRIMYLTHITKIDIFLLFKSYHIWIMTNIHLCYRYVIVYIDSSYLKAEREDILQN